MKAVILAGGSGTRLWPLSRRCFPKQFLKIGDDETLLQKTAGRLLSRVSPEDLVVITNEEYRFHVRAQLEHLYREPEDGHIICEPVGRNTAPAIALTIKYFMERCGADPNEVILISPSDHIITPEEKFARYLEAAEEVARTGHIVTFGVHPYRPETGYGYIQRGEPAPAEPTADGIQAYRVKRFVEKPDLELAKKYLLSGDYYWNSGMFAFTIGTMLDELKAHAPDIFEKMNVGFEEMLENFHRMPNISIDYAVMEKSKHVMVLPMDITWSDVGSWDSVHEILDKDENSNVKIGDVLDIDTKNSLIIGNRRLITTVGLEDVVVVETEDAVLVSRRGDAQRVKEVVGELRKYGKKQTEEHLTIYRPWGSYTVLEEGRRYKIKRIVVKPGARLSLQLHHHRSEHWVVITGTAKITIGDKVFFLHENESAYVPKSTPHRLENPGRVVLEIIEVQNGEYVGEDDIKRLDDEYGR